MKIPAASQLPFVIIGAGGHASVVAAVLRSMGCTVRGMTDRDPSRTGSIVMGWPVLGEDAILDAFAPKTVHLANGVGVQPRANGDGPPDPGTGQRCRIFIKLTKVKFDLPPIIHPSAVIAEGAEIAAGAQVMAGAVVQPRALIGENVVVNSSASIDHDCRIGAHAFIAPGAVLCGNAMVGAGAMIGAGAVVLPGVSIGDRALIGAGAVVRHDVGDGQFRV